MNIWIALFWGLMLVGSAAAIYGLHRFCLWLEERGWLYYKHKKPTSSPASCFVAFQQVIEPQAKHVLQIKDEKRSSAEHETPGQSDPPQDAS